MNQPLVQNDELGLKNRVALVTGGSRGIGKAVVGLFASYGTHVAVNYVSDEAAAKATVNLAQDHGVKALAIQADVSRLDRAEQLVQETVEHFGRLDFLICNAGIWEGAPVEAISEELWDKTLEINLKGTWSVCRAAVPEMKRQRFGRIVIVSSTAGQRGEANVSNYAASKGGQISFTKSLAPELGGFGINVNCVAPGWVETDMTADALADKVTQESIKKSSPLGRVATPEEIAGPIVFLCSTWANHITGEVLNVNGGSVLCG
ncbi:MAG TPA: 3-oxoacyl-ACP reductase family protein [Pyrinomonadaceae bacterium]|jgi:3-oxoacyl-[acyl-carrier protein] reductase|nr:3-oxoacyl-ACP reductase family protein [Pyrinomonadaceae bacterium]